MDRPAWPDDIESHLDPDAPIEQLGRSRWRIGQHTVSNLGPDGIGAVPELGRFLGRLAEVVPFGVPRVVAAASDWLVTERPPGQPADRPELHPEPGALAGRIGAGLASLHALPPVLDRLGQDPEDDGWGAIVDRCRRAVEAGAVDPGQLPAPYDRYPPERLLELLIEAGERGGDRPDGSDGRDTGVLCHGSATAGHFLIEGDRLVGIDGFDVAVVADRHLDLAAAHLSVARVLGAEAVFALYEGYGVDPDLARLDRAILAVRLLGLPGLAGVEA